MSEHLSDQEQIQVLKKWWSQYGMTIILGLCVFLVTTYGFRYWKQYHTRKLDFASLTYSEILSANETGKTDQIELLTQNLMKDYAGTAYASLAAMLAAKDAVVAGKLQDAEAKLQWVVDHDRQKTLRQLARVRLARVLLAENKQTKALDVLDKIEDVALTGAVLEARGDVFAALGKKQEALQAYQSALDNNKANGSESPLLQIKMQNVI